MSYDEWKTTDPDAEFLGDNRQAGERSEGVMSEEERMAELEGDIVESEKWIERVEAENSQLRKLNTELEKAVAIGNELVAAQEELNAELLGLLKGVIPILRNHDYRATVGIIQRQIAKAEAFK
jgi:hypothetical protein